MARTVLEPVPVPRLRQKVRALYAAQISVCDDAALGRLFCSDASPNGLTGKAIRNWFDGEGRRGPDEVPGERFNRLVEIFQARLPHQRSFAEARSMLLAPTELDLMLAFVSGAPIQSWIRVVLAAQEADVTLLRAGPSRTLSVTARRRVFDNIHGAVSVPLGEQFRFEVRPRLGWLTIIQWGADGWYGLDLDEGTVTLERDDGVVTLPPARPYFREEAAGMRRFLFIHTGEPLPPDVKEALLLSATAAVALDIAVLNRLAHIAASSPDFHIGTLDVMFCGSVSDDAALSDGEGQSER